MNISNQVKKIREQSGVTQEQLAQAVGVSRQTIIAMEKGNYLPSLLLALRLGDFFKLGVEKLFSLKK